jgi:hypothetical protein
MGRCVDAAPPLNAILLPIYSSTLLFIYFFSLFSLFSFYSSIVLSSPVPRFSDSPFHFLSWSTVVFSSFLLIPISYTLTLCAPRYALCSFMHPCNHAFMHLFGLWSWHF